MKRRKDVFVPDDFEVVNNSCTKEELKAISAFLKAKGVSIYRKKKSNLKLKSKKKAA